MRTLLKVFVFLTVSCFVLPLAAEEGDNPDDDGTERYVDLMPAFVVNYGPYRQRLKYFKAELTVRVESREDASIIKGNMDLLRDKLVMLFGEQSGAELAAGDAQLKLSAKTRDALNAILKKEFKRDEIVTDVLFTSFVVQH